MTLRDIFVFLFKWKTTTLGIPVFVTAAVAALVYWLPPSYQASSIVLIERSAAGASPVTYLPNQSMIEILNTEAAIIKSRPVLDAVVDELRPQERLKENESILNVIRDQLVQVGLLNSLSPREKWIERLQRQLTVKLGTQSSIVTISFSHEDPAWAQSIVNSVTQNYIRHHSNIFSSPGLSNFYQTRLSEVQDRLSTLHNQLSGIKSSEGVEPEDQRSLYDNLNSLRVELAKRRGELLDLEGRFAPGHEQIQTARAKVADIEAGIVSATDKLSRAEKATPRIAQVSDMIANEEQTLRSVKTEYDAALLAERSESSFADVRLVAAATLPQEPNMSRLLLIVIGLAVSLVMAPMIAAIREYFDQRAANLAEIGNILGLPSLGAVFDFGRAAKLAEN